MKALRRWCWVGCVVAGLLGATSARADGGQVNFSGAIVEPTCSVGVQRIGEVQTQGSQHFHCTERAGVTPGQAAQAYQLTVALGDALPADRLIGYFAGYLNAQPKLVTQTYD